MAPSRPPRPPARPARDPKELLKKRGADLIRKVSDKDRYAIFLEPVDPTQVDGYSDLIERPMDLSTLHKNLQVGVYRTPMELRADLDLIWSNCCSFNADDSIYYKEAVRLRSLCARYYDELCRVLSRDGVAAPLGLANSRRTGPYAHNTSKRPPRHRMPNGTGPPSGGVSSSLHTSEPTSPEPDADASGSASASASASAAQQPTFRDAQIRRASAASDAAVAASAAAAEEARAAAIAAGVPPNASSSPSQIFSGPGGVLRKDAPRVDALSAREFPTMNHRITRDRCSEIPIAWRRIGRWHTRGATLSKFNTRERARDVRYGLLLQRYVQKSAPLARRLLATVLDAEAVRQHDLDAIALATSLKQQNGGVVFEKNGLLNCTPRDTGTVPMEVQNGFHGDLHVNGICDPMDLDEDGSELTPDKAEEGRTKRPRRRNSPTQVNEGAGDVAGSPGEQFVNKLLGPGGISETYWKGNENIAKQTCSPSKKEISRLQTLLKEHAIDPSFLGGLLSSLPSSETRKTNVQAEGRQSGDPGSPGEALERLLNANHAVMMNVLRLRALRESADEADCEDLEDREREYVETLAKGMSLVVKKLPPRVVVHPADAAETAIAMSQSMQVRPHAPQAQK